MSLVANRKDYARAFKKHYKAYCTWKETGHDDSNSIILFYCVECGLKCLFMEKLRIFAVKDADKKNGNILQSHNLKELLKELRMEGYDFPEIITKHNDKVSLNEYHQMRRYCIEPRDRNNYTKMKNHEIELYSIAEHIAEEGRF